MNIFSWIKNNKLSSFLFLVIAIFIIAGVTSNSTSQFKNYSIPMMPQVGGGNYASTDFKSSLADMGTAGISADRASLDINQENVTSSTDRKVIQESNLSIQVKNVSEAMTVIRNSIEKDGGFMVSSNLSTPQDAASGTLIVRVPAEKLEATLKFIRQQSLKVVSENLYGRDITDQYTDLEARLATLRATKIKFEEILKTATKTADILEVQRQIINIQNQIDSVKGQQQYLDKSANMAKITLYLSTDEFALPYAPSEAWRPEVIFKTAVRSMVGTLRWIGGLVIWLVVYAPVWLLISAVIWLIRRRMKNKANN